MIAFIGGSKGRNDMVVSIEEQRIKDRNRRRHQLAPERLPSEYQKDAPTLRSADEPGFLSRLWRRLRG